MIGFNLSVANPFKYQEFQSLFDRSWSVGRYKTLEVQISRYAYNLLEVSLDTAWRGTDHAGPKLELGLLGWNISVGLQDNRHWDYVNHCWENYD